MISGTTLPTSSSSSSSSSFSSSLPSSSQNARGRRKLGGILVFCSQQQQQQQQRRALECASQASVVCGTSAAACSATLHSTGRNPRPSCIRRKGKNVAASAISFQQNGSGKVGKVSFLGEDLHSEKSKSSSFFGKVVEIKEKMKQLGLPALISYGLLNTLYYVFAFLIAFWSYSAIAPGSPAKGVGGQFGQAFLVFSVVYAGSQVTKLFRASGALLMAPQVEKLLAFTQTKLRLKSQVQAAVLVTILCFALAFVTFTSSVLLKARFVA